MTTENTSRGVKRGIATRIWSRTRWWVLAATILHEAVFQGNSRYITWDENTQIAAAQALVDGYGLTTTSANLDDLSRPIREPLLRFPPGFSLVFATCLSLLDDVWLAHAIINAVSVGLFYAAWFAIVEAMGSAVGGVTKLVLWSFWLFAWQPFPYMNTGEILCVAVFSWALWFGMHCIRSQRWVLCSVASALCVTVAAACRYAYWPLAFSFPVALVLVALASDRRVKLLSSALVLGLVCLVLLGGLAAVQHGRTGHAAFVEEMASETPAATGSLYWGHLWRIAPFPCCAVGYPVTWLQNSRAPQIWSWVTRKIAFFAQPRSNAIGWLVSVAVLGAAVWPVFQYGRGGMVWAGAGTERQVVWFFVMVASVVSGVTLIMLCWLSLRSPFQNVGWDRGGPWTYVQEVRYFVPLIPFLAVGVAGCVARLLAWNPPRAFGWLRTGAIVAITGWCVLGAVSRANYTVASAWNYKGRVDERRAETRTRRIVYASVRRHIAAGYAVMFVNRGFSGPTQYAIMAGAVRFKPEKLGSASLTTTGPVVVMTIVSDGGKAAPLAAARAAADYCRIAPGQLQFRSVDRLPEGWLMEAVVAATPHLADTVAVAGPTQ